MEKVWRHLCQAWARSKDFWAAVSCLPADTSLACQDKISTYCLYPVTLPVLTSRISGHTHILTALSLSMSHKAAHKQTRRGHDSLNKGGPTLHPSITLRQEAWSLELNTSILSVQATGFVGGHMLDGCQDSKAAEHCKSQDNRTALVSLTSYSTCHPLTEADCIFSASCRLQIRFGLK